MRRWLKRFMIFMLPMAIVLVGLTAYLALVYGEALPNSIVILIQQNNETVEFDPKTLEQIFAYKLAAINQIEPEFLFLGTSTSRHYQPYFIENSDLAYNAYIGAMRPEEATFYVTNIAEPLPKIILYGIDVWAYIRDDRTYAASRIDEDLVLGTNPLQQIVEGTRDTIQHIILGESQGPEITLLNQGDSSEPIRLGLGNRGFGYLLRGNRTFPTHVPIGRRGWANSRERALILFDFYDGRIGRTASTSDIRTSAMVAIEEMLQFAQAHDIILVGYTPPIIPRVYDKVTTAPCYSYFPHTISEISLLFEQYDMPPFIDLSNLEDVNGGTIAELQDSHHPSSILTLRVFRELVSRLEDTFSPYVSVEYLDELLSQPQYQYEPVSDEATYNPPEPQFADYLNKGIQDRACGYLDDALASINQALTMNPDHAEAHYQRGLIHYALSNFDDAFADFEQYIQLAPDNREKTERIRNINELRENS